MAKNRRSTKTIKTKVRPPVIPDESTLELHSGNVLQEETYSNTLFLDCDLSGLNLKYLDISHSLLRGVKLEDFQCERLALNDVRFESCDLSLAKFPAAGVNRVEFVNCRLTGIQPLETRFSDVKFVDCALDFALFRFTEFEAALFEGCSLRESDFQSADLRGVRFLNCVLESAQFFHSQMEMTDLRGSKLEGLKVGAPELTGAIIDSGQLIEFAHDWARLLGLQVDE